MVCCCGQGVPQRLFSEEEIEKGTAVELEEDFGIVPGHSQGFELTEARSLQESLGETEGFVATDPERGILKPAADAGEIVQHRSVDCGFELSCAGAAEPTREVCSGDTGGIELPSHVLTDELSQRPPELPRIGQLGKLSKPRS